MCCELGSWRCLCSFIWYDEIMALGRALSSELPEQNKTLIDLVATTTVPLPVFESECDIAG